MGGSITKRVPEIELMKAIAIVGMVLVHVLEGSMSVFLNAWELPGSIPYTIVEFFGCIPAAGAFTFAMGWGAACSKTATTRSFLKRALILGLLILYVNFMYAILPMLLDPQNFGSFFDSPWILIGFNIYSFGTVSMLFFALLKKFDDKPAVRAGICIAAFVIIFIVDIIAVPGKYAESDNQWLASVIGFFVRQNEYSWFPIVPWGIFPIFGYGAAHLYKKWNNRKKFAWTAFIAGAIAIPACVIANNVLGLPQGAANPAWIEDGMDYYALSPINVICALGILCVEMAVCFAILTLTKGKLHWLISDMSHYVMFIFCLQWVFISPMFVVLIHVTDIWTNLLIGVVTLVVIIVVTEIYKKIRTGKVRT